MTLVGAERVERDAEAASPLGLVQGQSGPLRFVANQNWMENATLRAMLEDPEAALRSAKAVLKDDRRSTIARIDGLVLKRFNRRTVRHGIRDAFRRSDAARSWDCGWQLLAAGLPTAEPIAYADRRAPGFLVCSYLIMRAVPKALSFGQYLTRPGCSPSAELVRELARTIARFHNAGFHWNRDINDRNILASNGKSIYLVDVDGVRWTARGASARQRRDLQTLRDALSAYPQFGPEYAAVFMNAYRRTRGG